MARTRHTDPDEIRARRRAADPRQPRGANDASSVHVQARLLKEAGIDPPTTPPDAERHLSLPRISRSRPRRGHLHPLEPLDIRKALRALGPVATYGVTAIELRSAPYADDGSLQFGSYRLPGTITLYEQPEPPWRLPGLDEPSIASLERVGARIERTPQDFIVLLEPDQLRSLMAVEGLFHEIGHHVIQQYRGKRGVKRMRTTDHERRARAFAVACWHAWIDAVEP